MGIPAENHPCGFKWAIEAKVHRNAKTIVVDPRLTRTAATADMYLQIRAGADIAFLGGVINYAIQNNRIAHDYLVNYTNAAFIIKDGFKLPDDGLYSGFDPEKQVYDKATWNYEEGGDLTGKPVMPTPAAQAPPAPHAVGGGKSGLRNRKDRDIKVRVPLGRRAELRRGRCCRRKLRLISRCSIRAASSNFSKSNTNATRPRWWSASPEFRKTSS